MSDNTGRAISGRQESVIPWWYIIIGIDVFLVLVTMGAKYFPESAPLQFIGRPFNLAVEMNLAVWWSGICLAAAGMLCYEMFSTSNDSTKSGWLALSLLLFGLSLDEVGSLHERIGGWLNLLPYGIICAGLYGYAFYKLVKDTATRKSAIIITIAFILYGSVAVQEYFEHAISWPEWMLAFRLGVEEGTELFATFLILFSIVPHRGLATNSISAIIPQPVRFKYINFLVSLSILAHVVIYFAFPELSEASHKGNSLVWYPMVQFLILSSIVYWISQNVLDTDYQSKILSVVFILCSAALMWNLLYFVPIVGNFLPGKALGFLLYLVALLLITLWSIKRSAVNVRVLLSLGMSVVVLIISLLYYVKERNFTLGVWSNVSVFYGYFLLFALKELSFRNHPATDPNSS